MTCDELSGLLPAYADGEIDGPDRAEVDAHLAACPSCREEVSGLVSFHSFVHERCAPAAVALAPDELRRRIHRELGREHLRDQAKRFTAVSAVAASFVVVASVGYVIGLPGESGEVVYQEDAVEKHLRGLPVEAPAGQEERLLAGKLPFHASAPRFKNASFVGARLGNVRERDAAYFIYEAGPSRRVSVLAYAGERGEPDDGAVRVVSGRKVKLHSVRGHNVVEWSDRGVVYNLVTDADEEFALTLLRQLEQR